MKSAMDRISELENENNTLRAEWEKAVQERGEAVQQAKLAKKAFGEELAVKENEINELLEEEDDGDDVYEEEEDSCLFHTHPFLVRMKILMMLAIGVAPSLVVKWMSHL